jgi:YD repeat-containing protein
MSHRAASLSRLSFAALLLLLLSLSPRESFAAAFYDCIRSTLNVNGTPVAYIDHDCNRVYETGEFGGGGGGWGASGGGGFSGNRGDRQDVQDASEKDSCEQRANPIIPGTGNKIEPETDFVSVGEMPLTLRRTYNRYWKYPGLFGRYWVSSFDYSLVWQTIPDTSGNTRIYAQRPDGRRIKFVPGGADRWNEDKPQPVAYIQKNADGTYTHYSENLPLETYDGGGRPLTIRNRQGIGWIFSYTNNFLTKVTHSSGRSVLFTWTGDQLTQVTAPDGSAFAYTYTANVFGAGKHRLASATSPSATGNDLTSIQYYYEKAGMPGALTGKAYGGVRYSWFDYDSEGRAILSAHGSAGDIDKYTFAYSGAGSPPANPPRDPPDPGWICNTVTHVCTPPALRPGGPSPDDPEMAANEAEAEQEAALIDVIAATMTTTETNPYNKVTRYTYSDGRLVGVVGEASANCPRRSMSITYDTNGYENLVTDFNGNVTDYDYNAKGQLQQKIEAKGTSVARTTTYGWDSTYNRMTRETVVGDHETTYLYGSDHYLASATIKNLSSNGVANQTHTWTYAYTKYASGIVQTMVVDGPQAVPSAGDAITYAYNAQGDITAIRNTFGHATSFANYDGLGQPGRATGPNGDNTDYAYFPGGRLKQVTTYPNGVGATTAYTYSTGLLKSSRSPDGVTTLYTYDGARRLGAIDIPELNGTAQQVFAYDSASNPTATGIYRFGDATSRFGAFTDYDELGRIIGRRGFNGQNVRYAYDNNGNLKKITDSLNRVTSFTYDELNRLSTRTDAKNGITRYGYDFDDRVIRVTDPIGVVTTYTYDGFGQIWRQTSPDTGTVTYGYTASGFRNSMNRADGVATSYSYDDIGRLSSIAAGGKNQALEYDTCTNGKQRLCKVTDSSGVLAYTYTPQGQVATHRVDHAAPHGGTTAYGYTYDSNGRSTKISNQVSGVERQFTYASGQLSAVKVKIGAAAPVNVATNFSYEPMGPLKGFTYGNGLARGRAYDRNYRLTGISTNPASGATVQNLGYSYNANDLITNITNGVDGVASQNYGYDELARLTSVTSGLGNQSFTYDANGNRTSHTNGGVLWSLGNYTGKNSHTFWTSAAQTLYYNYDANGNTTAITGTTYTYDPFNRLSRMVRGGVTTDYEVNALGQRVYKKVGAQATWYAYAPDHSLLAELPAGSPRWTEYL